MTQADYENDDKRQLDITDPSGVETKIEPAVADCCGAGCSSRDSASKIKCSGAVVYQFISILEPNATSHLCRAHAKELSNWGGEYEQDDYTEKQEEHHGGWYESKPSDKETESTD